MNSKDVSKISPERWRIAKIFKSHIYKAIEELSIDYAVTFQDKFDKTPIRIEIDLKRRNTFDKIGLKPES